jgi:3-hydroxyisobutyrate dehydrogenase-like beta-hydroxyacid dehydrogenase
MTGKALIGFGEAGQAFAQGDGWRAFDIDPAKTRVATLAQALDGADIIVSVVTADQALIAAKQAAAIISIGTLFCDMNSVAPGTKQAAAQAIEAMWMWQSCLRSILPGWRHRCWSAAPMPMKVRLG